MKMKLREKKIDFDEMRRLISESSLESSIYIGADSKTFKRDGKRSCAYCVSVIIHRDSKHGGKGYHQITIEPDHGNIKDPDLRLMNEVYKIVKVMEEIHDSIGERHYEVHLDVNSNPKYKSSKVMTQAMGLIRGCFSIEPKIKPEAWAASTISDKYAVRTAKYSKNTVRSGRAKRENRANNK
jgi:hypothetical protein